MMVSTGLQSVLHNGGGSGTYQKHGGLVMYDSAAENRAGNSNAAMLVSSIIPSSVQNLPCSLRCKVRRVVHL